MGASWLAKHCGLSNLGHEAFFAGLLHDVGKLFILTVIDDLAHSQKLNFQPSNALLLEVMDTLHCRHGHSLMIQWNLPRQYCDIARDHHSQEFDSDHSLLIMVRLANLACNKLGIGLKEDSALVLAAAPEAGMLDVSEVDLARLEIMLEDSKVYASGGQ
jgi:HD-like signal output (HDOD) protein